MNTQWEPVNWAPANPATAPPTQLTTARAGESPRIYKIKEKDVFTGERSKLRAWLARMKVYFRLEEWADGHDTEGLVYTSSLLAESAAPWMTPYIENLEQFAEEL